MKAQVWIHADALSYPQPPVNTNNVNHRVADVNVKKTQIARFDSHTILIAKDTMHTQPERACFSVWIAFSGAIGMSSVQTHGQAIRMRYAHSVRSNCYVRANVASVRFARINARARIHAILYIARGRARVVSLFFFYKSLTL